MSLNPAVPTDRFGYDGDVPAILFDTLVLSAISVLFFWIAIAVIAKALFLDRSRGRRRCPRCWYDMSESPSLRCSECGRVARNERDLHRTRRHWRLASAGLAVLLVVPVAAWIPKVQRDGFWRSIPDTALLTLMSLGAGVDEESPAARQLAGRLRQAVPKQGATTEAIWDWQRRWAYEIAAARLTHLDPGASTPGNDLSTPRTSYDHLMLTALDTPDFERFDLGDVIADDRPVRVVASESDLATERDRSMIEVICTPSFPHFKYRVTITPRVAWLPMARHTFTGAEVGYAIMSAEDDAPPGTHRVPFDVVVEFASLGIYGSYGPEEFAPFDKTTAMATITIPQRPDEAITPK